MTVLDYVLNTPQSLNKVWVDEEPISLILMKSQQKVKALLNGIKIGAMDKHIECLCFRDVKSLEY